MFKGEVTHLRGIIFGPVNPDQVIQEVPQAILFHQEAVIHQVFMVVHHPAAAGLPHRTAADLQDRYQGVLTLQDSALPQGLRQVVDPQVVVLHQGDRLNQYNSVKEVHSLNKEWWDSFTKKEIL